MDSSVAAARRQLALERAIKALGGSVAHRVIPSKAPELECELFEAELLAAFAERVAALDKQLADLEDRVSKLGRVAKAAE